MNKKAKNDKTFNKFKDIINIQERLDEYFDIVSNLKDGIDRIEEDLLIFKKPEFDISTHFFSYYDKQFYVDLINIKNKNGKDIQEINDNKIFIVKVENKLRLFKARLKNIQNDIKLQQEKLNNTLEEISDPNSQKILKEASLQAINYIEEYLNEQKLTTSNLNKLTKKFDKLSDPKSKMSKGEKAGFIILAICTLFIAASFKKVRNAFKSHNKRVIRNINNISNITSPYNENLLKINRIIEGITNKKRPIFKKLNEDSKAGFLLLKNVLEDEINKIKSYNVGFKQKVDKYYSFRELSKKPSKNDKTL